MSDLKDFYMDHFDNCDYCQEIDERKDLPEEERIRLINAHTTTALADRGDMLHDAYKDN